MYIDLTHLVSSTISVYPGTPSPIINEIYKIKEDGFRETLYSFYSHIGTHIDSPSHIVENGKSLDEFLMDKFIGNAYTIDVSGFYDKCISLEFIKQFVDKLNTNDFILFYSGYDKLWNTDAYFKNYPLFSKEAIQFISSFNIKGIGIDFISVDSIDSEDFYNHKVLLSKEIIIIENLTKLNTIIGRNVVFYGAPINIENANGSLVRAYAKCLD
ncbi:cyclase family protein [Helicovermis profundi]|uniref:Cyclase family protein n=1 Tax=Helicovermis profundi TaxID=3065157 RepID=A0AAU9ED99_9FIRM|nr:cyclase family protein [Clostridia bacterium S502]